MLLIDDRLEMNTKTHLLLQEDDSSEKESRNYNRGVFRAVAWLAQSIKTFLGPHLQLRTRWPLTLTITTLVYGAGLAFGIVISQYMQIAYSTPHSISYCALNVCKTIDCNLISWQHRQDLLSATKDKASTLRTTVSIVFIPAFQPIIKRKHGRTFSLVRSYV